MFRTCSGVSLWESEPFQVLPDESVGVLFEIRTPRNGRGGAKSPWPPECFLRCFRQHGGYGGRCPGPCPHRNNSSIYSQLTHSSYCPDSQSLICSGLLSLHSRLSTHSQVPDAILGLALTLWRAKARRCTYRSSIY